MMIFSMLPFFMFAMYEKHGQPLEDILKHYFAVRFLNPKQRPYKTNNFYAVIMRQARLDKEVKQIVTGKQNKPSKTDKSR